MQANGTPGRIRTCDHLLRRQMLYPTELQALKKKAQLELNYAKTWSGGGFEPRPSGPKPDAANCATLRLRFSMTFRYRGAYFTVVNSTCQPFILVFMAYHLLLDVLVRHRKG